MPEAAKKVEFGDLNKENRITGIGKLVENGTSLNFH